MSNNVPRLRFQGFNDEWEDEKLDNLGNTFTGLSGKTKEDFGHGEAQFVPYVNVYKNPITDLAFLEKVEIDSRQNSVTRGDIFFTTSSETPEEVGLSSIWLGNSTNTYLNSFCFGFRPDKNLDSYYMAFLLRSPSIRSKIKLLAQGISRYNISKTKMMEIMIPIPLKSEQEKIGAFFKTLDQLISLQEKKIALLKEQKKGFLQKLFPKDGAKVPELRFAGFADDWEEHKLGEVIDIENGYAFKSEYFSDEEKRHIVLTPGSVKIGGGFQKDKGRYYDVSGVFPEKFIFKPGNIFITMTDLTPTAQSLGYPAIVPRDDNVYLHNQRLGKIINTTTNPEFLYTLLTTDTYHKEIVSSASGTTVKHSSVSKILDFKSAIPNIDEQKLIGSFFKELDNTIALHQRKLDLLKEQKKGFLQKMFV